MYMFLTFFKSYEEEVVVVGAEEQDNSNDSINISG